MARELEAERVNIEVITNAYPGKVQFHKVEVAEMLSVGVRKVDKLVKKNKFGKYSVGDIAKAISG